MSATTKSTGSGYTRHPFHTRNNRVLDKVLVRLDGGFVTVLPGDGKPCNDFTKTAATNADNRLIGIDRVTWYLVQAVHDLNQCTIHIGTDGKLHLHRAAAKISG